MLDRDVEKKRRAAADTHIVVDKKFKFVLRIIQSQQPLEEFREKWSWLLDEHSDQHIWILLFRLVERQISAISNKRS